MRLPISVTKKQKLFIDAKESEIIVTGLAASFNTVTGVGNGVDYPFTFNMAATPEEQGQATLTVNGKDYHYVSMNYMFVPVDAEDGSATVGLEYEIVTDKGSIKHEIENVPIRENYRTNVIGNLFTKESKFEIIVDERFETPDQIVVLSADKLQESLDNATRGDNTIFLGADIKGIWHIGKEIPRGTKALTKYPEGISRIEHGDEGMVVSHFTNNGRQYIAFVNRSCTEETTLEIGFETEAFCIAKDGTESPMTTSYRIEPGDILIFTW